MTTIDHPSDVASAAASGASATERFHADKSPYAAVKDTPAERVDTAGPRGARRRPRHDPPAQGHLRRVQRAQGVADRCRAGRRMAAVPRRLGRARRRGRRHRPPRGQQGQHRGPVLRAGRTRIGRQGHDPDARRRAGHPAGVARPHHRHRRRTAAGQGRTLARRRRRLLLAVRAGHPGVEPARQLLDWTRRRPSRSPRFAPRRTRFRPTGHAGS